MSCANVKKTFDLNSLCVQARITYSKDKVCYYQLLGSNLWNVFMERFMLEETKWVRYGQFQSIQMMRT